MAGYKAKYYGEVVDDDIPTTTNADAAKAVIGAIFGEATTLLGTSLELYGTGYMMVGFALCTTGQVVKEYGINFKRKHYTTLENWSKTH